MVKSADWLVDELADLKHKVCGEEARFGPGLSFSPSVDRGLCES